MSTLREFIRDWKPTDEAVKAVAEDTTAFPIMRSLAVELMKTRTAAKAALHHVRELEEAWHTGDISECDHLGGTRSNRNVDVRVFLEAALTPAARVKGMEER